MSVLRSLIPTESTHLLFAEVIRKVRHHDLILGRNTVLGRSTLLWLSRRTWLAVLWGVHSRGTLGSLLGCKSLVGRLGQGNDLAWDVYRALVVDLLLR